MTLRNCVGTFVDELLQDFIAETRETLAALASEIVAWEADPADRARLDAIFRFVHTVKGSCGFLDLPRLATLSHEAENVLAAVRDGRRVPDTRLVTAVLAVVDRIGELTEAIDAGVGIETDGDALLIAALDERAVGENAAAIWVLPEEAAGTAAATVRAGPRPAHRSVRLPVDLLDRMMNGMSEMVLARNELARKLRDGRSDPASDAALERLSLTVADMRETVGRTRMQPIDGLFAALPRIVRDTANQLGKQVTLAIEGSDVEIDREMIEAMRDPLLHVIRNAIDHGIESPAARVAAGKPAVGRLTVTARQSGNTIVVAVQDDGAGIDVPRLVAKHARVHGRDPAEYAMMSERARLDLVFEPGLSSRDTVTEVSGRGVGMDVVRSNIELIGGRLELVNDPGRGLSIVAHVPLTLSILPTVVLGVAGQRFAVARQSVDEIVSATSASVRIDPLGDGHVVSVRGEHMPLVDLSGVLALSAPNPRERAMLAIVAVAGGAFALAVDCVHDMEELVVKSAAPPVMVSGLFAGQTLPDTGVPMLVLDPAGIAQASGIVFTRRIAAEVETAPVAVGLEALLVRDRDGARRAIPLIAVDRIEDVDASQLAMTGGSLRLTRSGGIVPAVARTALPTTGVVTVVRLHGGGREIAYAIAEPIEIATLPLDWAETEPGLGLLGVALHEGGAVEIIDPGKLLRVQSDAADGQPICLLAGETRGWMADFLAPVLERAGYTVATEPPAGGAVAVLAMEHEDVDVPAGAVVVRLAERPGGAAVFRYDRAGVVAALRAAR